MRTIPLMLFAGATLALSGCFTITETEFPRVEMVRAAKGAPALALAGFEARVTTFVPIYGYATVWNSSPGYYHRGHYHRGWDYPSTVSTTTYIPQTQMTSAYIEKAQDILETAGYVISATNAACVVDVKFSGPAVTDGDRTAEFATLLFSAFTADYSRAAWSARLKVTDVASGKVIFTQTYQQDYAASVWGPIPLFSPLSSDKVQDDYIQNWCLSALTERAMADVTAFLAAQVRPAAAP